MFRGAQRQQPLPDGAGLGVFAGARLARVRLGQPVQRQLLGGLAQRLAGAVVEAVLHDAGQERPQLARVGEVPPRLAEAGQQVGPDRLQHVRRIEPRLRLRRQPPPHFLPWRRPVARIVAWQAVRKAGSMRFGVTEWR